MFQLLIEKYPETLVVKDKWGDIPLLYALWCNAPTEVVDLLVESYKTNHPEYEFDWKGMIRTLAKASVTHANIHELVMLSDQKYGMQQVVLALATCNKQGFRSLLYTSDETFRYLLRLSISDRLDTLDVERFQEDLKNRINEVGEEISRDEDTQAVYDRLATYESIKEGTSVLELALWKAKIDESRNKRTRVGEDVSYRDLCRINCRVDIVIRNVLPYLLPKRILSGHDSTRVEDSSNESSDESSYYST